MSEKEREDKGVFSLSFLAFSNAWTQQLLPLATKFLPQYLPVLHA